jgi:hypothetical protein
MVKYSLDTRIGVERLKSPKYRIFLVIGLLRAKKLLGLASAPRLAGALGGQS